MRRALCICPDTSIGANPSFEIICRSLVKLGYQIDIVTRGMPLHAFNIPGVRVLPYTYREAWIHIVKRDQKPSLSHWKEFLKWRLRSNREHLPSLDTLHHFLHDSYDLYLGADPLGIESAWWARGKSEAPLVYVSYEILFNDEVSRYGMEAAKEGEELAAKDVNLVISPDQERDTQLRENLDLHKAKSCFLPVAPEDGEVASDKDGLRERLAIPAEKKILLYTGYLGRWASMDVLPHLLPLMPDNWFLVIHSRSSQKDSGFMNNWGLITDTSRVRFSSGVPATELPALVASADIGLASYQTVGGEWPCEKNLYHLGLSSGKFASYCMAGLPVIASGMPVFKRLHQEYKYGGVYDTIFDLPDIIKNMDLNAAGQEARRLYEDQLDPALYRDDLDKALGSLG